MAKSLELTYRMAGKEASVNFYEGIATFIFGIALGVGSMDMAHEMNKPQKPDMVRKDIQPAVQLINCADKINSVAELGRICRARRRMEQVR